MTLPRHQRFIGGYSPVTKTNILMIADYVWWSDNEREILNWMAEHLPRGIEHQQGMVLSFDCEKDMFWFLMKWQA